MSILEIYYDLETTGLDTKVLDVVEIASLMKESSESFECLVFSKYIPHHLKSIHGITTEMVKNEPHITQRLIEWTDWIEKQRNAKLYDKVVLIAHNGNRFDNKIIKRLLTLLPSAYQEIWNNRYYFADSLAPIQKTHDHKAGLDFLIQKYYPEALNNEKRHRALFDCECLKETWNRLPNKIKSQEYLDLNITKVAEFGTNTTTKKTATKKRKTYPSSPVAIIAATNDQKTPLKEHITAPIFLSRILEKVNLLQFIHSEDNQAFEQRNVQTFVLQHSAFIDQSKKLLEDLQSELKAMILESNTIEKEEKKIEKEEQHKNQEEFKTENQSNPTVTFSGCIVEPCILNFETEQKVSPIL